MAQLWNTLQSRPSALAMGRLHMLSLNQSLSGAFPELSASFDIELMELGGSGSTPMLLSTGTRALDARKARALPLNK